MGCVQGKCCGRYRRRYKSSTGGSDAGSSRYRHVLSGIPLASAIVPSDHLLLQYSSLTQRGYYPGSPDRENQDSFFIKTQFQDNPNLHFFAVFDGHGEFGARCAQFVRDRLAATLSADARLLFDPVKAYNSAFLTVNSELRDSDIEETMSGTTAIAVLLSGDTLYVANVGDSRAVAGVWDGESVVAEELSCDQTPFRKDEYERVKLCGARVLNIQQVEGTMDPTIQHWGDEENNDGDPPRLWLQDAMYPGTAFTRSVGDTTAESIGVIAVPEVKTVKISPSHLFFVIASDGVFEFLSSQAVVDMVSRFADPRDACSAIAAESYKIWLEREGRTDDITIIVVHIKDMSDSNSGENDQIIRTSSKPSVTSERVKACCQKRGTITELQSCSSDFTTERSLSCVAPSPPHPLSTGM
ncbi:probable protein phosphatase 2C 35 [Typha latifolia]|uniref:probable protein phosphatase 2C 35 n=1 Tax=Typha latifolia TaxID=4733 RepID=UPI003C2F6975